MNRLKKAVWNNRGGVNQFVATIVSILAILMFFLALTAGLKAMNEYTTLNNYADQLAATAGNEGRCSGPALQSRYRELETATGLHPTVEYSASYFDTNQRTVQYGDTITVTLTLQTHVAAVGVSIPLNLQSVKSVQSQQYWK